MLVAASKQGFLFPKPTFNPASTAQLPKTVPPTNAPDRVLFRVKSQSIGPYRVGVLDVYDGKAWRFAPVAEGGLNDVDVVRCRPAQRADRRHRRDHHRWLLR